MPFSFDIPLTQRVAMLNRQFDGASAQDMLRAILSGRAGKIALVSSFGAESVVLLHMVSELDPATDIVFLDTLKLFRATTLYQKDVAKHLGLTNVHTVSPDTNELLVQDNEGLLHQSDTTACCRLRKVEPLTKALGAFDGWISGRKRHQTKHRQEMPIWEDDGFGRLKLNPLATWSAEDLRDYITDHNLPRHPLATRGLPSIGCEPCTTRPKPELDPRSGRWSGTQKTECGIHLK